MEVAVTEKFKSLFDQVEDVVHDVGERESRECLGFQDDQLVLCNGRTIEQISPAKSTEWMIKAKLAEQAGTCETADCTYEGQILWLTLVLAAIG